ncbi:MAG: glycoside hydrolase family 5 protein [Fimbriimonas sp.]
MPRYGFNFLWAFIWNEGKPMRPADERALDFLAAHGLDFVRIPTDYRFWTRDFDYFHPDERVLEILDTHLEACRARGLHMSLNVHRGPGYCINRPDLERDNLWTDPIAEDGFVFQWETFARRYRGVSNDSLSFDLLNEPPHVGKLGMTREIHERIMRRTVAAIRAIDPDREIVIDGLGGGSYAMPELVDLGVTQSGRGYQPMPVSHYEAGWWAGHVGLPEPIYPDSAWDLEKLREFYAPWREVERQGNPVHIGEFGCFNRTPNDVALRWLGDLFTLYREYGWGYALWNFEGPFGIVHHGRPGARYEDVMGYPVDRELFDLFLNGRSHLE